ncbi:MAG: tetratricopeptide repeat protein [bacterium]
MKLTVRYVLLIGLVGVTVLSQCSRREGRRKIKLDTAAIRQAQASSRLATTLQVQPEERRSIVVFYFENVTGDEDLDWMRRGLTEMLITDLSQSRYLDVVGEHDLAAIMNRMGITDPLAMDASVAVSVAREARLETVLVGGFVRVGENIRIDAQLYDARTGSLLKTDRVECRGLEEIFTMVDELTRRVRDGLKLTLKGVVEFDKDLADATTNSIEAYRCFTEGLQRYDKLFFQEAAQHFERAAAIDTTFATAYARLALAYSSLGRSEDARRVLARAVVLADRVTERERLNIMALDAGFKDDLLRMIETYEEMVRLFPKDKEARYRLGTIYNALGRFDEAIAQFEAALEIDNTYKLVHNVLGYSYSSRGMYEKAVESLRRYLELAPDEPNPHDSIGEIYQRAGYLDEAIDEYKEALRLKSDLHFPWQHMGSAYMDKGKFDQALSAFRRYIEVSPSDYLKSHGHRCAGEAYWAKGRYEEALKEYREAMKVYPNNFHLASSIGQLYEEQGDTVEARKFREEWFRSAEERVLKEESFDIVRDFLGACLYSDLHPDELEPFIDRAMELAENDFNRATCTFMRAMANLKQGESDSALAQFRAAVLPFLSIKTREGIGWYDASYISRAIARASADPEQGQAFFEEVIEMTREMKNTALEAGIRYLLLEHYETTGDEESLERELAATGTPRESDWWIIGPFENAGGFHRRFPPERETKLTKSYRGKGGKVRWKQAQDSLFDGYVNLKELYEPDTWTVAYGLLSVQSPMARPAQLRIGTNDATKVWLNGEEVWVRNVRRGALVDDDVIPVELKEGTNTILIKVTQADGEWGFFFRVTDPEGNPFDDITYVPRITS